jgi:hypothetical protein
MVQQVAAAVFNVTVFMSSKFLVLIFGDKVTKSREQNKGIRSFFCQDGVSSPILSAKLRKSLNMVSDFKD